MSLAELRADTHAVISGIRLEEADAAWLRAMGVVEGQPVRVLRSAPFGGPLQVQVGEAAFALARSLAAAVDVTTRVG